MVERSQDARSGDFRGKAGNGASVAPESVEGIEVLLIIDSESQQRLIGFDIERVPGRAVLRGAET